jgi:serine/threonine protein kinase
MSVPGQAITCRTCGRTFTGGERFCPFDRTDLVTGAAPGTGDPLIGKVLGGAYTLHSKLGGGGMGVVYRAKQNRLNRDVAVKILSPQMGSTESAAERFRTEALSVSQLSNPHTVAVYDFGAEDGLLYLAMQLIEGESLRKRLDRGPFSLKSAASIAAQICESLAEAHDLKPQIVHRDIKPDNILIRVMPDGADFATVLDFGLAKLADTDRLTATGIVVGTPAYMAPEQARDDGKMDNRVDLYALGCVLYEMIAGRTPFTAATAASLLYKHVWDPVPLFSEVCPERQVSGELEQIVLDMLAKDPDERPHSAHTVRQRLLDLLPSLSAESPRAKGANRPNPTPQPTIDATAASPGASRLKTTSPPRGTGTSAAPSIIVVPEEEDTTATALPEVLPRKKANPLIYLAVGVVALAAIGVTVFALSRDKVEAAPIANEVVHEIPAPPPAPAPVERPAPAAPPPVAAVIPSATLPVPHSVAAESAPHEPSASEHVRESSESARAESKRGDATHAAHHPATAKPVTVVVKPIADQPEKPAAPAPQPKKKSADGDFDIVPP